MHRRLLTTVLLLTLLVTGCSRKEPVDVREQSNAAATTAPERTASPRAASGTASATPLVSSPPASAAPASTVAATAGPTATPTATLSPTPLSTAAPSTAPALIPQAIASDSPTAIVSSGVVYLVTKSFEEVDPAVAYRDAWDGATAALTKAGVANLPPPPAYTHDLVNASQQHREAFPKLEELAAGRLTPEALTTAALTEAANRRHDCHSQYFPKAAAAALVQQPPDAPVRLGVAFAEGTPLRIRAILPGSPAQDAGLLPGQRVLTFNGRDGASLTGREGAQIIRQEGATPMALRVQEGDGSVRDLTLSAAAVPLVSRTVLPGNIGLVEFESFPVGNQVETQMREALTTFEAQGVQGWIMDLRLNLGGQSPVDVAGLFAQSDRMYGMLARGATQPSWAETIANLLPFQRPLAILVGPDTLSAAEMLAGFLQGSGRATVIGQTSGGCVGRDQTIPLADGSRIGAHDVEVVVGPDGRRLNGIGLTPNVVVPPAPDAIGDPVLEAGVRALQQMIGGR